MSSAHLSKSLPLPRPRMDEFVLGFDKPGIVSILGCGPGTPKVFASLRRTLSTDMSSRNWMEQNGFFPMKKADEVDTLKKDVGGCGGQVYLWKSVKEAGKDVGSEELGVRSNTWGSILFQKVEDSKSLPPPYTHPLVKRSKSTLSTRSLEICTESLGSETGSDGFSSYPASEVGDMEVEDELLSQASPLDVEVFSDVRYTEVAARKTRPRSFPPPIQSLSQGNRGGSLSMHSRRDNGRLVLEAVSIPLEKNFEARREAGRLVLTFAANEQICHTDEEEDDELVKEMDEDIFEEMVIGTAEFALECHQELSNGGMINAQRTATMMEKTTPSLNWDPAKLGKYNESFHYEVDEEEKAILLEQSLLTPSTETASDSLNGYDYEEYFWRKKSTATISIASTMKAHSSSSNNINESWESQLLRRKDGYSSPSSQGCSSPSRSNLLWEPKCIATS